MPAKLHDNITKVTLRVRTEDLDLLQALHGYGGVNPFIRDLLRAYCDRQRDRLSGHPNSST